MNDKECLSIWDFDAFLEKKAIIDEFGNSVSYLELVREAESVSLAIKGRCLVFSMCQNEIGSVIGYVSFLNSGIVPALLNSHLERSLLDDLIELYHPSYLWMSDRRRGDFQELELVYEAYGYVLLKTEFTDPVSMYPKLALLLTTSGSTGSPKFVRQSYENIRANTEAIIKYLELDASERPITTLPMNYTYGLSIINTHLAVGATILLTDKTLMQKEFWSFFQEQRATSFGGVPYTYEILNKLRFFRMELPHLRTMTQAGGKLTPDLHEKFAEYAADNGKKFIVMYGQCEATARMGYLPADKAKEKKGSMGIAIPGGKFKLIDVNGAEIHLPHMTGELVYEGANVTLGYAENAVDLAKGDERNGVLMTGDMARHDEDGYYYIVGRKKRFLKIYGNRVSLDEMDSLIKGKYAIEVACAGVDDHLHIFLTDESLSGEVRDYVSKITKLNPVAFQTIVIDEIPKNDSGKIKYTELEKYYVV